MTRPQEKAKIVVAKYYSMVEELGTTFDPHLPYPLSCIPGWAVS